MILSLFYSVFVVQFLSKYNYIRSLPDISMVCSVRTGLVLVVGGNRRHRGDVYLSVVCGSLSVYVSAGRLAGSLLSSPSSLEFHV